ncbi:unnamed protein product [Urochloa humidicola]
MHELAANIGGKQYTNNANATLHRMLLSRAACTGKNFGRQCLYKCTGLHWIRNDGSLRGTMRCGVAD